MPKSRATWLGGLHPHLQRLCPLQGRWQTGLWVLLMLMPLVNVIIAFLICLGVAQQFNKSAVFGIGIFFLPFIFYAILAFGDATYVGAATA